MKTGTAPWPRLAFMLLLSLLVPSRPAGAAPLADREELDGGPVLLHVERHALPIVQVRIGIGAGQVMEPEGKAGLSNLTAALLTEGTESRSSRQIAEAIEFTGGSLGASGGDEYAELSLTVLGKDLELGFELLSDILLHPTFPQAELDRKRDLILAAIRRQQEDPGTVAAKAWTRRLYGDHPLAWPSEGTETSLPAITRDDVIAFHRRYYVRNNAWVVAVGDIDAGRLHQLVRRYLGDWTSGAAPPQAPPPPPAARGSRTLLLDRPITQANILMGHLGIERTHPDYYAVLVMNYILGGGGFASRLMDNIRDNRGLAYSVYSAFIPGRTTGRFQVGLETKNASANTAVEEVLKEMRRIQGGPVSAQELKDAKAYITGSFPLRMDSNAKLADLLVSVESFGLGMNYVEDYLSAVRAVSVADVQRVARTYLHPDRMLLVVVADQQKAAVVPRGKDLSEQD